MNDCQFPAKTPRRADYRWTEQQVGRDDAVGFISKDILRDAAFPTTAQTRDAVVGYAEAVANWVEPIYAVKAAWAEFSRTINNAGMTVAVLGAG